jgi:hypothetical protein
LIGRIRRLLPALALAALAALAVSPATAQVVPGSVAPNFTKTALGGAATSLSDYSGKVVVLFLLGYG